MEKEIEVAKVISRRKGDELLFYKWDKAEQEYYPVVAYGLCYFKEFEGAIQNLGFPSARVVKVKGGKKVQIVIEIDNEDFTEGED